VIAFRHHVKVLFSHPSDALKYLPTVSFAFNKANETFGKLLSIHFDVYYWERDAYRSWGDAQLSINRDLVQSADIVVATFESRLGTPVHSYESGTDEEIRISSNHGNKHIWVYFSEDGYAVATTSEQERLKKYKEDIGKLCFYSNFCNEEELRESLFRQISLYVENFNAALGNKTDTTSGTAALSGNNTFMVSGNTAQNQQFIQNATLHGGNFIGRSGQSLHKGDVSE